jgi:uncharacterized cupin superfamily protein
MGNTMKIEVEKPTEQYLQDHKVRSWKIWQTKVREDKRKFTRFEWCHYEAEEYYLLEGKVVVDAQEGKVDLVAGDFVTFPAHLSCVWTIKESVRLHYHHHFPKEYGPHPNPALQKIFREKPWQGQKPEDADIIFLSLDANYSPCININLIKQYHDDGVSFWIDNKVHHPFLTEQYTDTSGKFFHETFALMKLKPTCADYVSFVELLHYPTVGSRGSNKVDYELAHLRRIDRILSKAKISFVLSSAKSGVYPEMLRIKKNNSDIFQWLPKSVNDAVALPVLYKDSMRTTYMPYHFSCTGDARDKLVGQQLPIMSEIITAYIESIGL